MDAFERQKRRGIVHGYEVPPADKSGTARLYPRLETTFLGIPMKTPVIAASGTFGNGPEYAEYVDLRRQVGAISVKGLTPDGRSGNAGCRIAETPSGVLNCIGLENPGAQAFVETVLPTLRRYDVPLFANVSAGTIEEFGYMAETLSVPGISAIEVNVSCPNVKKEGMAFGVDPHTVEAVAREVKNRTDLPVIMKLSPNVTDIVSIARAAVAGGADAISLINTLLGMAIDVRTRRPILGNLYGGLSGPAVKPVALRMVHQVSQAVDVPIIGMGGIMTGTDAAEFLLAGADVVSVGTATLVDPRAIAIIDEQLDDYLEGQQVAHVSDLVGQLQPYR